MKNIDKIKVIQSINSVIDFINQKVCEDFFWKRENNLTSFTNMSDYQENVCIRENELIDELNKIKESIL